MKNHTKRGLKIQYKNRTIKNTGGYGYFFSNNESSKKKDDNQEDKPQDKPQDKQELPISDKDTYIYRSSKLSIKPISEDYTQIGIFHISESTAINIVRGFGTGISNIFGAKGFDNTIYDRLRNDVFKKIEDSLEENQKVFSIKMDFETNPQGTIFLHFYGDLCEKSVVETSAPASQVATPNNDTISPNVTDQQPTVGNI